MLQRNELIRGYWFTCAVVAICCVWSANADIISIPGDYPTIQEGIDNSVEGDEIVVADGIWTGVGNRDLNFGGLAVTLRSENGPENCILDCEGANNDPHRAIFMNSGEGSFTVVSGLTIFNGYVDEDALGGGNGGAIYLENCSPTIVNCILESNSAYDNPLAFGGAIYSKGGNPTITGCIFRDNSTQSSFGGGGALYLEDGNITVRDCDFFSCSSYGECSGLGGAVYNRNNTSKFINCIFEGNTVIGGSCGGQADASGGAMLNIECISVYLINCTFRANWADAPWAKGGGVSNRSAAIAINCLFDGNTLGGPSSTKGGGWYGQGTLVNCTFVRNEATGGSFEGGALWGENILAVNCNVIGNQGWDGGAIAGNGELSNCIVRDNIDTQIIGTFDVNYSNIQDGWAGIGNIDVDPDFVDAANFDLRLIPGSPCIDAGDNTILPPDTFDLDNDGDTKEPIPLDMDGLARFVDDVCTTDTGNGTAPLVDMGAYEFQGSSCSTELTGVSVVTGILLDGDLAALLDSDDVYVHTRSGFGRTFVDLHNMEMIVSAITSVDAPNTINLTIESRIDEPAGFAQIKLRNWNTNQFESVGSYSIGNTDNVDTINGISAVNYVDGGGNIDLSIKHMVFVPFFAFTFESFVDQVEISVN